MSVLKASSGGHNLTRLDDVMEVGSMLTALVAFRRTSDSTFGESPLQLTSAGGAYGVSVTQGTPDEINGNFAGFGGTSGGPTPTVDSWFFALLQINAGAGTIRAMANGAGAWPTVITASPITNITAEDLQIFDDNIIGEVAFVKIWAGKLISLADALTECTRRDIVTNLGYANRCHPMRNGALTADSTGKGHTLTQNGTLVYSANEPTDITADNDGLVIADLIPPAVLGVAYTHQLLAFYGTEPYTWSVQSGALPAGLSLNASTGEITGTPTALGATAVTIRVTDDAAETYDLVTSIAVTLLEDQTYTGVNSADATPDVGYPAHSTGDMVVLWCKADDDDNISLPAAGPGSETIVAIANGDSGSTSGPALAGCYFIANAGRAAGTLAFGIDGGGEEWQGIGYRVRAANVAATPLDTVSAVGGTGGADSVNVPTTAVTASANATGGEVVCVACGDADPFAETVPAGWRQRDNRDIGAVSGILATRDALASAGVSIASVTFTLGAADTSSCFVYVHNAPAGGGGGGDGGELLPGVGLQNLDGGFGPAKPAGLGGVLVH